MINQAWLNSFTTGLVGLWLVLLAGRMFKQIEIDWWMVFLPLVAWVIMYFVAKTLAGWARGIQRDAVRIAKEERIQ